jgi:hypothetical protein
MLHLPPLRLHCVGGCWDRTQDSFHFGINGCQTVLTTHQSKKPEQDLHRSEKLGAAEAHIGTVKGLTTSVADLHHLILHAPRSQVIKVIFVIPNFDPLNVFSFSSF